MDMNGIVLEATDRHGAFAGSMLRLPTGRLLVSFGRLDYERALSEHATVASDDHGLSWNRPRVVASSEGLPKTLRGASLSRLRDGRIAMISDAPDDGFAIRWSRDDGETWSAPTLGAPTGTVPGGNPIAELDDGTLVLTSRAPKGGTPARKCVLAYRSSDSGATWSGPIVVAERSGRNYTEPSTISLPSGCLLTVIRENSYNYRTSAASTSDDAGLTWSPPEPVPIVGHEHAAGLLDDGRLCVAYRNAGGHAGVRMWAGDIGERGYGGPTATRSSDASARVADGALRVRVGGVGEAVQYHLHPPEDSRSVVTFEAQLRCVSNERNACAIHVPQAGWLDVFPDGIAFGQRGERRSVDFTRYRRLVVVRGPEQLVVSVDGDEILRTRDLDRGEVLRNVGGTITRTNVLTFGTRGTLSGSPDDVAKGEAEWRSASSRIENADGTAHAWLWQASDGAPPNYYETERTVEVDSRFGESLYYLGQPAWVQLPNGDIFVVYGHQFVRPDGQRSSRLLSRTIHLSSLGSEGVET